MSLALAGVLAALPAAAQWTRVDTNGLTPGPNGILVGSVAANEAAVFATSGQPQRLYRSDDDGGSWTRVAAVPDPAGFPTVFTTGQTVLVHDITFTSGSILHVSTDGGATWAQRTAPPPLDVAVNINTVARVDLPAGRSHAFVVNQNPNRLFVTHDDFATVEPALPDLAIDQIVSNGRVLLAVPLRTTNPISYYRSADGGRTWTVAYTGALAADAAFASRDSLFVVRLAPTATNPTRVALFGSPDGTTFPELAVLSSGPSSVIESSPEHSAVYFSFRLSVHGGRSPQSIRAGFPEQTTGPVVTACHSNAGSGTNRALSSRAVYLIASCDDTGAYVAGALYRHEVVGATVAGEAAPDAGGVALRVAGNPARDRARVTVSLDAPASARLVLVDAQGRGVATVADRALPAGETPLTLVTSGLAPGVYWLRLEAAGRVATEAVTVVR